MTEKQSAKFVEWEGRKWPVLEAEKMAGLLEFSADYLRQLERAGRFAKLSHDRYSPPAVIKGVLAHMRDDARRINKTSAQTRVQEARAKEIELRTARDEGRLIEIESVEAVFADILGAYRSELAGVPAAATRDLAIRETISAALESAIDRCRARFAAAAEAARNGEEMSAAAIAMPAPAKTPKRKAQANGG
jgi:hypothetical protein